MDIKDIIRKLYDQDKMVVNDDNLLVSRVWLELGWSDYKSLYANLTDLPSAETITRARRKLHQDGEIEYSKEVDEARFKKFIEMKEEYSEAKADDYTEYERENEWSYYDRNADLDRMR